MIIALFWVEWTKLLATWVSEARLENIPEQQISLVKDHLDQYPRSSPDERRTHLESIWTGLNLDQITGIKPEPKVPDKTASRSEI